MCNPDPLGECSMVGSVKWNNYRTNYNSERCVWGPYLVKMSSCEGVGVVASVPIGALLII